MMHRRLGVLPAMLSLFTLLCALAACSAGSDSSQTAEPVVRHAIEAVDENVFTAKVQQHTRAAEEEAERKAAEEEAKRKAAEEEAAREAAEKAEAEAAEEEAKAAQEEPSSQEAEGSSSQESSQGTAEQALGGVSAEAIYASLDVVQDFRSSFVHGSKPASVQKYIVLHDTEGDGSPESVVGYWDGNGAGVAAHFVVGRDGHVVQCVALDNITHHAGFGDTGHNASFGVEDESRDDKVGTVPIGDWAADYGMNSYSIGIEMVHVGGGAAYTEEQLAAVDKVIAYIDAYYGFQSTIIDHKAWRSGNSDTSPEFAGYLANYQTLRHH